jgi:hypothetical protein
MRSAFLVLLLFATGAQAQDADFVFVDRSNPAYGVLARLPGETRATVVAKLPAGAPADLVDWAAFQANPAGIVAPLIQKDEYAGSNLAAGVLALLEKYPRTPFGVTWSGGLAVTRNDYQHAERIHRLFRERPEDYERAKVSHDRRRDPIHPDNHLGPLLGR